MLTQGKARRTAPGSETAKAPSRPAHPKLSAICLRSNIHAAGNGFKCYEVSDALPQARPDLFQAFHQDGILNPFAANESEAAFIRECLKTPNFLASQITY